MAWERTVGVSLVREMAEDRVVVGVLNEVEPSEQFFGIVRTVRSGVAHRPSSSRTKTLASPAVPRP